MAYGSFQARDWIHVGSFNTRCWTRAWTCISTGDWSCCVRFLTQYIYFVFLGLYPWHIEAPKLGVQLQLQLAAYTTAMQHLSHICNLCHSSWQHGILDLLSEARDGICVLRDTVSSDHFCWAMTWTPRCHIWKLSNDFRWICYKKRIRLPQQKSLQVKYLCVFAWSLICRTWIEYLFSVVNAENPTKTNPRIDYPIPILSFILISTPGFIQGGRQCA